MDRVSSLGAQLVSPLYPEQANLKPILGVFVLYRTGNVKIAVERLFPSIL
jgi:hypothetical protein